jgi:mono/diheme cytochrome c family protein
MLLFSRLQWLALLVSAATSSVIADEPDLNRDIRPLLQRHCSGCHGPTVQKGGLRLDARHAFFKGGDSGPVVVAKDPAASELLRRLRSTDPDTQMPPEGPRMPAADIEQLERWIAAGAEWPESDYDREAARDRRLEHWAFQPLRNHSPPVVSGLPAEATPLDHFIAHSLHQSGLAMNPPADRRTLIRRASLILTGLLPSPDRVERFVSDRSPAAWPELVDELLSSPHYGERWAQHWLDVIRYADTHGFEVNTPRDNAWPYRDYVIRAFNEDRPYNRFILEQLAGDIYKEDAATGFLVASAVLLPGQIGADDESKRLARQDALDEIISGTSGTLLGMTIACARCHDHKFDPISQQDYYNMQAFFAGVAYGDRPLRDADNSERQRQAAELRPRIGHLESQLRRCEPLALTRRTLIIDEDSDPRVQFLQTPNGPGANPAGAQRGHRDDPGSSTQPGNLSRGRYTWWNNIPGQDVLSWTPGVEGRFQLWLSWGAHGSGVHTRDARIVLDNDGSSETRDDQTELASIDQYYQAGVSSGQTEQTPLWSGLLPAGTLSLNAQSRLFLRGGSTGTGITADVIVLQEVAAQDADTGANTASSAAPLKQSALPQLRDPVSPRRNTELFAPTTVRHLRFVCHETSNQNQYQPCLDELEAFGPDQPASNLALATSGVITSSSGNIAETGIHQLKHINDGLYGNDHSWISNELGRGWVQLTWPAPVVLDRIVWGRDREGRFLDRLPVRYEVQVSLDGVTWTTVAGHSDRAPFGTPWDSLMALQRAAAGTEEAGVEQLSAELQQLRDRLTALEAPRMVFAGVFHSPHPTFVLRRGDPEQRLQETRPEVPALFAAIPLTTTASLPAESAIPQSLTEDQTRRLALARWMVSPDNPLTARVFVNRVWQQHFGTGLVDTPNDFGLNGSSPSHPELLDWLATDFIHSGWSLKSLQRQILLSAAWQQSAVRHDAGQQLDRDNRLLWRFSARRMEAEAIRDCMLQVSGELNLQSGGPGFSFFGSRGGLNGFPPIESFTPAEMRRMVYSHRVRMEAVPVFGAFDCPDAGQSMPRRSRSTTAIQALNLFNSPFAVDRAAQFAARVEAARPNAPAEQLNHAFELAFGRSATAEEHAVMDEAIKNHGLATISRVLLNSNEFLLIP